MCAASSLALIAEVRDAIGDLPMLAARGIADGRGLAAVIPLCADGAVFGTRFFASQEAAAHPIFKRRVLAAHAAEAVHTTLFDVGWPHAPHRVIRTKVVDEWELAGCPESGKRPSEGQPIGTMRGRGIEMPLVKYTVAAPTEYNRARSRERLPFYAGELVSLVREMLPPKQTMKKVAEEARGAISDRQAPLTK